MATLPKGTKLQPYWRACLDDLHSSYEGVCAYLCVYIERALGATSTDHFVAKSRDVSQAYEWSNYRLACNAMNGRKGNFDAVLDPFNLSIDTFRLELVTGHIYPNPQLAPAEEQRAAETIRRLGLDDGVCRELRSRRFTEYLLLRGLTSNPEPQQLLRRCAPFIWYEADRQGLL
ncbi:MAG: hypothetical protein RBU37_07655 [Myxococcota bacterium]|jgi:uncharacterized protein (TIGR02646 family)|nr:hypothetical protein [Myxococcota bacterium]